LKAMEALGRRGIPSGCHGGGCGVCKVRVLSGRYHTDTMSREHVSAEEEKEGIVLACRTYPQTDITVSVIGKLNKAVTRKKYGFI
ncbi:MAG: 2Fe-2S iron-sulfur cluster-binding protein, partial [Sneathiella sp.]